MPGYAVASMVVWLVAAFELALVATFAFLSLSGDSWGIARGMATGLACVFALTMGPAIWLLRSGRPTVAAIVSVISALAYVGLWRNA